MNKVFSIIITESGNKVDIFKNPTASHLREIRRGHRDKHPDWPATEIVRETTDSHGNKYFWAGADAIHKQVLERLKCRGIVLPVDA